MKLQKQENNKKEYIWKPDRRVFNTVVMQRGSKVL